MIDLLEITPHPQFTKELPADPLETNQSRQVHNACFSWAPTKLPSCPEMVHLSDVLLGELQLSVADREALLKIVSGAAPFGVFKSYAMCYGGHQFGNWAGQLGDGRAINIADLVIKEKPIQLQLKGAGPTPYSRGSDGLAVLRSSIREYLCSEAMHHLGVPTTRALSLVKTGDLVMRDMLYNGNPQQEQGAIVCRVAPSFIRFGNFQIFASRGEIGELRQLVDYTIKHHFSHLGKPSKETYITFFQEVATLTREMIVHWQRVGFVHGVMNTDNLSILGLTIDYGPYGWLEDYNPGWTPNTTDAQQHRYRFGNQPYIGLWNLAQLGNALYPLIEEAAPLQAVLESYRKDYTDDYHHMMTGKLGLYQSDDVAASFIDTLVDLMTKTEMDMTIFFRQICDLKDDTIASFWNILVKASYLESGELEVSKSEWEAWHKQWRKLIAKESFDDHGRKARMRAINPKYVLRNYMAQVAIDAAEKGDYSIVEELYQLLLKPYDEQMEMDKWFAKRPEWARHKVGCSMLSCSS